MPHLNQNETSQTTITPQELQEILALRAAQQSAASSAASATTVDVAEALEIPEQEVQSLLGQVRAGNNPVASARRRRKFTRAAKAASAAIGLVFVFNFNFVPNGPDNPPLTVETVSVKPEAAKLSGYSDHTHFVHVDVIYQYHPSSLKHLLFGPHGDRPWQWPTVSDDSGEHQFFPSLGGGQISATDGWNYRIGLTHFHAGFEFPLNTQPGHDATLTQDDAIDGDNFTVSIPLDNN